MRHGFDAGSGKLSIPFVRCGFYATRSAAKGNGVCAPRCGFGVGSQQAQPPFLWAKAKWPRHDKALSREPRRTPPFSLSKPALTLSRHPILDRIAKNSESAALAGVDAENRYWIGTLLSYCGQKDAAVRLLRSSVEHNYCAYTALQTDPLLVKLRGTPEFNGLLSAAKQCQNRLLVQRPQ